MSSSFLPGPADARVSQDIHKCLCHGDECNRSFSSAGEGGAADTTAAGQDTIQVINKLGWGREDGQGRADLPYKT